MDLIDRLYNPRWTVCKTADGEDRRLDETEAIAVMREAAAEIEHLRESFQDIKKQAKSA